MQNPLPHSHWRHYKSIGGIDHTYEVVGIAKHSETEEEMVIYRPLYEVSEDSWVYGYDFAVRPLSMWYDIVEYGGKEVQRFTQIYIFYNMFTLEQIKQAHSQVKSGADFSRYIQDIKTLGVIFYEVSLRDGQVEYCGVDNFRVVTFTGCDPLDISSIIDLEQFKSDLKNHQNGNTDYGRFCDDCAKSGIEKWRVTMDTMTCTYYDSHQNEVLIEKIPG